MQINIFSENIHETIDVDEKKAIDTAKKILKFYLSEENILNKSCLGGKEFNCISFDILHCDNEKTHKINKEYRKKDYPADIITFAVFADSEEKFILDGEINLGEIIISLDKVVENAEKERGSEEIVRSEELVVSSDFVALQRNLTNQSLDNSIQKTPNSSLLTPHSSVIFNAELNFLISHGIMHLLGFDHQTNEDYTFIIKAQSAALKSLEVQHGKL